MTSARCATCDGTGQIVYGPNGEVVPGCEAGDWYTEQELGQVHVFTCPDCVNGNC